MIRSWTMDCFLYKDTTGQAPKDEIMEIAQSDEDGGKGRSGDAAHGDDFAALDYDDALAFARMLAPTPGIEGVDIGSGG
jgi:hypothetical protein